MLTFVNFLVASYPLAELQPAFELFPGGGWLEELRLRPLSPARAGTWAELGNNVAEEDLKMTNNFPYSKIVILPKNYLKPEPTILDLTSSSVPKCKLLKLLQLFEHSNNINYLSFLNYLYFLNLLDLS